MSKLIALRLPDDVYAEVRKRMGATGQSAFIINALYVYLEKIEPGNPSSWQQYGAGVPLAAPANESPVRQLLKAKPSAVLSKLAHSPACKCLMCKGGA